MVNGWAKRADHQIGKYIPPDRVLDADLREGDESKFEVSPKMGRILLAENASPLVKVQETICFAQYFTFIQLKAVSLFGQSFMLANHNVSVAIL